MWQVDLSDLKTSTPSGLFQLHFLMFVTEQSKYCVVNHNRPMVMLSLQPHQFAMITIIKAATTGLILTIRALISKINFFSPSIIDPPVGNGSANTSVQQHSEHGASKQAFECLPILLISTQLTRGTKTNNMNLLDPNHWKTVDFFPSLVVVLKWWSHYGLGL